MSQAATGGVDEAVSVVLRLSAPPEAEARVRWDEDPRRWVPVEMPWISRRKPVQPF